MKSLCFDKRIKYLHEENHIEKNKRMPLNIGRMLKNLPIKFKYNVAILYVKCIQNFYEKTSINS